MKVGCCGFCTAMEKYFAKFPVIEVQKTFYKPPRPETAKGWREKADSVNPDFEFTVKAWQVITHPPSSPTYRKAGISPKNCGYFRLSETVMKAWEATKEIADILRARIIVFQTPPSFRDNEENIERARQFFSRISREEYILVWEPRGWSDESVRRVCEETGVVHCVDPFVSDPVAGRIAYFRLHGFGLGCRNSPMGKLNYRHVYSDEELKWLLDYVEKFSKERYVMFNNTNMCKDAERFMDLASQRLVSE